MALALNPSASYVEVFEAPLPGLYVFAWSPYTNGNLSFAFDGDPEKTLSFGVAYLLQAGDTVHHKGPAASLAGVRLGDEL